MSSFIWDDLLWSERGWEGFLASRAEAGCQGSEVSYKPLAGPQLVGKGGDMTYCQFTNGFAFLQFPFCAPRQEGCFLAR